MRERKQSTSQERRKKMHSEEFDWTMTGNEAPDSRHQASYEAEEEQRRRAAYEAEEEQRRRAAYEAEEERRRRSAYEAQEKRRRQAAYEAQEERRRQVAYAAQEEQRRQAVYEDDRQAGNRRSKSYEDDPMRPQREIRDDYQRSSKGGKRKKHTFGKFIAIIQGLLSIAILALLFILNVLPNMYLVAGAAILLFLWMFAFFSQFTRKSHIPGKIFSLLMCGLLGLVGYYLLVTQNMLSQITNFTYSIDNMVVVVLQDDAAQSLQDAKDYTFGVRSSYDGETLTHSIEEIESEVGQSIVTLDYSTLNDQVQALYDHQVGAIIYNENMEGSIEEIYPYFSTETRRLDNVEIKTKVEMADTSDVTVTKEPFLMYISGNDSYGELSLKGRSDVNMLVAVNPQTKQILMINTPRDYYTAFPGVTNGVKDKLTHSGNYGIECTMDTLESIYGCDIDYYVRVNFSSLINIVDALGGVTVYSDYDFTAIDGRHFNQGANDLDGESALMFARERYAFENGDFQRGRDQQLLLTAMIQKAMSPAILTRYADLMASLQDSFATNMPQDSITGLIKMQLGDGSDWNIVTMAASGTTDTQFCYSLNDTASVVIPDETSVSACKIMLDKLYNGEILEDPSQTTVTGE